MAPLVMLAIDSGARQGELLALRWADLELDEVSSTSAVAFDAKMVGSSSPSRRRGGAEGR